MPLSHVPVVYGLTVIQFCWPQPKAFSPNDPGPVAAILLGRIMPDHCECVSAFLAEAIYLFLHIPSELGRIDREEISLDGWGSSRI
jgi:hypothetical protein